MKLTLANVHSYQLPDPSWQWVSPRWLIDMTLDVDDDGWQYSTRFSAGRWRGKHSATKSFVRRRRWVRLRRRLKTSETNSNVDGRSSTSIAQPNTEFNPNLHPPKHMPRARPVTDILIRNTVPSSPTSKNLRPLSKSNSSKNLAYTLKNGKYTLHRLSKASGYTKDLPSPIGNAGWQASGPRGLQLNPSILQQYESSSSSAITTTGSSRRHTWVKPSIASSDITVTPQQQSPGIDALKTWFDKEAPAYAKHRCMNSTKHTRNRDTLPLPTGGMASSNRTPPSDDSLAGSDSEFGAYVDGVPRRFPKLTGLMAPERTVPLDFDSAAKPHKIQAHEAVSTTQLDYLRRPGIPAHLDVNAAKSMHPSLSVPQINTKLGHLQTCQSALTPVTASTPPMPSSAASMAARQLLSAKSTRQHMFSLSAATSTDEDAASTMIASHAALAEQRSARLDSRASESGTEPELFSSNTSTRLGRPPSAALSAALSAAASLPPTPDSDSDSSCCLSPLSRASIASSDFQLGMLSPLGDYADPYMALQLPKDDGNLAAKQSVDLSLMEVMTMSLKRAISQISLDRERLAFLRGGLEQGGITAAAIWYNLPWLHYDLLNFDSARQRLIAMLLQYSHTCPLDALLFFTAPPSNNEGQGFSAESLLRTLSEREREEYQELLNRIGQAGDSVAMSPSQVWRFLVRPLVSCDGDLFYSDFKLMVVGVAKWSLCAKK
ncbi:hypothetical protein GGI12_002219 [Dipsacomyces acuminosporus]|nr:hypothetical protein GGI12_002219 [Dipsacomyces acuminosporus]